MKNIFSQIRLGICLLNSSYETVTIRQRAGKFALKYFTGVKEWLNRNCLDLTAISNVAIVISI